MNIMNLLNNKYQKLNTDTKLKTGSIVSFTLKEKLSKDTAIININGKDIKATFNKGLEGVNDNRGKIQITNINSDSISVDFVEVNKVENNTEVLDNLEGIDKKELEVIIKNLKNKGINLTKKDIEHIKEFIRKDSLPLKEKIDIINRLINKDIDITFKNIIAIKEALYGEGIDVSLNNIIEELSIPIDTSITEVEEENIIDLKSVKEVSDDISNHIIEKIVEDNDENFLDNNILTKDLEVNIDNSIGMNSIPKNITNMETNRQNKIIMTVVTEKMNLITENFKELKQTLVRNMDTVLFDNTIAKEEVKQNLENSLDLLNRKLLKSDITLYTDMMTEKKLIKISSKIDMAKILVLQNNINDAKTLIGEIKKDLNGLEFKASEEKVVYGITNEINKNFSDEKNIISSLYDFIKSPPTGSREAYDYIKGLGLNYENDILNEELFNLKNNNLEDNLKGNLLKIINQNNKSIKDISSIVKVLDNLNGQQLLNKSENSNPVQTMFFDIPINLVGKIENIKLLINSNKENEKLDWKNSSLYFLIETNKLGETGILINSKNRNLEITIRNDDNKIKDKITLIEDGFIEKLKDIGYNVGRIRYEKLSKVQKEEDKSSMLPTSIQDEYNSSRKGLDIRI
ncbi:hypothetical protein GOQ27_16645 [Clostridium sp. D2Q-11]|uniref:Uncharacterized protein n=1 Tax=Anaeromonas frigoriresistens TaxID=2683708 RepID=A0A942V0D7_9FIRM|nr:hypothetical protein [Anaeromonas frigoriresistens]MBS4540109.1 hypothetical protein [Anaeromonas frigoriresistens]